MAGAAGGGRAAGGARSPGAVCADAALRGPPRGPPRCRRGVRALEAQDTGRWDSALIAQAEQALWLASERRTPGPYQLEASIQSVHADRARTGATDWEAVHRLYRILARAHPSTGARVGLAASLGRVGQPAEGIAILDALDGDRVRLHQPFWAVRAHLLAATGATGAAREAYQRAAGLADDEAVRRWLLARRPEAGADMGDASEPSDAPETGAGSAPHKG